MLPKYLEEPLIIAGIVIVAQWLLGPFFTGIFEGLMKIQSVQYPTPEIASTVKGEFHRERLIGCVIALVAVLIYALIRRPGV